MASRLRAHLPRVALFVLLGLAATATLTYAAGQMPNSTPATTTTAAPTPPLVVPDVRNQAFVFAKGSLEDAGFAWRVLGSVHGYAANTVAAQSPAAGTRVLDTGAPLITLTLKRNGSYPQTGEAADASPYAGTVLQPAELAAAVGPAHPAATTSATTTAAPAALTPKAATPAKTPKTAKPITAAKPSAKRAAWTQNRPAAFTVPGARAEPLDEMPLTNRAQLLRSWLEAHPTQTSANVAHWSYQNAWIVAGAKFGWWRGAEALTTLIAVDRRAQQLWGIGNKSALQAQSALSEVQSRSK
jgi:beta-lactam-binding protein with PASTA domain